MESERYAAGIKEARRKIALGVADGLAYAEIARRLENIARFVDFVGESMIRAAEQTREVLCTKPETTSGTTPTPSSDRG